MTDLIEGYLRAAGVQHFRGHHDGEYVFLADVAAQTGRSAERHGKLHVHLRSSARSVLEISITPDRYYPAAHHGRLADLIAGWGAGVAAWAEVYESCDPALVGVVVGAEGRPDGIDGVAGLVDDAVAAAAALFASLNEQIPAHRTAMLRDAG
jgi:hypothetical protein